jgi:Cu(I)/Ag(I) efflux system periplasmic protein CusF
MKRIACTASIALLFALPLTADAVSCNGAPASKAHPRAMVDGEVRKVDKDARKITLRHSEIKHLNMPAMTMVFQVKDPAMLNKVKAGDKVKFMAEGAGSAFTVTEIQLAK